MPSRNIGAGVVSRNAVTALGPAAGAAQAWLWIAALLCHSCGVPGTGEASVSNGGMPITLSSLNASVSATGSSHPSDTFFGQKPEIIPFSFGGELDVAIRDSARDVVHVVHFARVAGTYTPVSAFTLPRLRVLMGLTRDDHGNYYIASGVDESGSYQFPIHRKNVVVITKTDPLGNKIADFDVDMARRDADPHSLPIQVPTFFSTARLLYVGGSLVLTHGMHMSTHEVLTTTQLDALDGRAQRVGTMWFSHVFDHRLLADDDGFIEMHLGEPFPRAIAGCRSPVGASVPIRNGCCQPFTLPGNSGENLDTQLGGLVALSGGGEFKYMVVFSTRRGAGIEQDVALVRLRNFGAEGDKVDTSATPQEAMQNGQHITNYLTWLTDLNGASAGKPRIAPVGSGKFVALWEQWSNDPKEFLGTHGVVIDSAGTIVLPSRKVSTNFISRGDDAVSVGTDVIYVTGGKGNSIILNIVDANLNTQEIVCK